jgi:hypothetical protein
MPSCRLRRLLWLQKPNRHDKGSLMVTVGADAAAPAVPSRGSTRVAPLPATDELEHKRHSEHQKQKKHNRADDCDRLAGDVDLQCVGAGQRQYRQKRSVGGGGTTAGR